MYLTDSANTPFQHRLGCCIQRVRPLDDSEWDFLQSTFAWLRMDLTWTGVEQSPGVYTFADVDAFVNEALDRGMSMLLILSFGNPITYPDLFPSTYAPPLTDAQYEKWAGYVEAAVEHYRGKDVAFEVWNEPQAPGYWYPYPNGSDYARLCRKTTDTIKAKNPDALVVAGGGFALSFWETTYNQYPLTPAIRPATAADVNTYPYFQRFNEDAIYGGAADDADCLSIHSYTDILPPEWEEVALAWLRTKTSAPIINSESGFSYGSPIPEPFTKAPDYRENNRAYDVLGKEKAAAWYLRRALIHPKFNVPISNVFIWRAMGYNPLRNPWEYARIPGRDDYAWWTFNSKLIVNTLGLSEYDDAAERTVKASTQHAFIEDYFVDDILVIDGGSGYPEPACDLTGGRATVPGHARIALKDGRVCGFQIVHPGPHLKGTSGYYYGFTFPVRALDERFGTAATQGVGTVSPAQDASYTGLTRPYPSTGSEGRNLLSPALSWSGGGAGEGATATIDAMGLHDFYVDAASTRWTLADNRPIRCVGGTAVLWNGLGYNRSHGFLSRINNQWLAQAACGAGYTAGETLTVNPGNQGGANATITVDTVGPIGNVGDVTITAAGTGYTAGDYVVFTSALASDSAEIAISSVDGNGAITGHSLDGGGSGYAAHDILTVEAGTAFNAVVHVDTVAGDGGILTYTMVSAGSGYSASTSAVLIPQAHVDALATIDSVNAAGGITGITMLPSGLYDPDDIPQAVAARTSYNPTTGAQTWTAETLPVLFQGFCVMGLTLTAGGTGYRVAPPVGFVLADTDSTGYNAAASTTVTDGAVATVTLSRNVDKKGSGYRYTQTPGVRLIAGTSGVFAWPRTYAGKVTDCIVEGCSSGFDPADPPTCTVVGGKNPAVAKVTSVGSPNGDVLAVEMIDSGYGYETGQQPAVVSVWRDYSGTWYNLTAGERPAGNTDTTPEGAVVNTALAIGKLTWIKIVDGGAGYSEAPTVTLIGGDGTGATLGTAEFDAGTGALTKIPITDGGSGWTYPPYVKLTGGGAGVTTPATVAAEVSGLASVTLTSSHGTDYRSDDLLVFTEPGRAAIVKPVMAAQPRPRTLFPVALALRNAVRTLTDYVYTEDLSTEAEVFHLRYVHKTDPDKEYRVIWCTEAEAATGTAIMGVGADTDKVVAVRVDKGGLYRIETTPEVVVAASPGVSAECECVVEDGRVVAVVMTKQGSGYTSTPSVTFAPVPKSPIPVPAGAIDATSYLGGLVSLGATVVPTTEPLFIRIER